MEENNEKFYAEIIETAGVFRITIPKQIMDGAEWKTGDRLKVLAIKQEKVVMEED